MSKKTIILSLSGVAGAVMLLGGLHGAQAFGDRDHGRNWGGKEFKMAHMWGGRGHHGRRHHRRGKGGFRHADRNGDGVVTLEEATKRRTMRFQRMDTDNNGEVTVEEAVEAKMRRIEKRIKRRLRMFDENGDGKVTREEFTLPVKERFEWRDLNKDGELSGDELPGRRWGRRGHRRGGDYESRPRREERREERREQRRQGDEL